MAEENSSLALVGTLDLDVAEAPEYSADDAGKGSEQLDASDVILPRVTLLQAMSRVVQSKVPGAEAGRFFAVPSNRPLTTEESPDLKIIVVRVYPTQRWWTPLDEGGGLICEAPGGDLVARQPNGLKGAKIRIEFGKGDAPKAVEWDGGEPTDRCLECVCGPAAARAAAGLHGPADNRGNGWLPKVVNVDGKQVKLPDKLRAPKCNGGIDVLAMVSVPAFGGMPGDVMPAFITFVRTGTPAGRQLSGMVKTAGREPAWARIYALGNRQVVNEKNSWFVPTVRQVGFAKRVVMDAASRLYDQSRVERYRPAVEDMGGEEDVPSTAGSPAPRDDERAPDDAF